MLKVLITLDGSSTADQALGVARELLAGKETDVTLLHVIPRHLIYTKAGTVPAESYDPDEEQIVSTILLNAAEHELRTAGVGPTLKKEVHAGDPAEVILTIAEADGVDLIILGSRGLGAARRFLLGSVSTKVTTHAHCAVLVAHPASGRHSASAATTDERVAVR
jgi:nucleotide-binding universal stress UspA family protein